MFMGHFRGRVVDRILGVATVRTKKAELIRESRSFMLSRIEDLMSEAEEWCDETENEEDLHDAIARVLDERESAQLVARAARDELDAVRAELVKNANTALEMHEQLKTEVKVLCHALGMPDGRSVLIADAKDTALLEIAKELVEADCAEYGFFPKALVEKMKIVCRSRQEWPSAPEGAPAMVWCHSDNQWFGASMPMPDGDGQWRKRYIRADVHDRVIKAAIAYYREQYEQHFPQTPNELEFFDAVEAMLEARGAERSTDG